MFVMVLVGVCVCVFVFWCVCVCVSRSVCVSVYRADRANLCQRHGLNGPMRWDNYDIEKGSSFGCWRGCKQTGCPPQSQAL